MKWCHSVILFMIACTTIAQDSANRDITRVSLSNGCTVVTNLFHGYLEGQFQVQHASARPATKAQYLLYACAIDDYLLKNKETLEKLGFAHLTVEGSCQSTILRYRTYEMEYKDVDPYSNCAAQDLKALEAFQKKGYTGRFTNDLQYVIGDLKKRTALDEIPVEQTQLGKAITREEKEQLVLLARKTVPGRQIQSICLHSWNHPIDLPVASVIFEPSRLTDEEYEFTQVTALNRNWQRRTNTNKLARIFSPETCWFLEKGSRGDRIKHRFNYLEKTIFLSVAEENTREEISAILRLFESGKAFRDGKVVKDIFSGNYNGIRKYTKDGAVFVDVSWHLGLSGGSHTFKLIGDTLVFEQMSHWQS